MSGITQDWRCWCSSLVVGSVLIASLQECVVAQITPDSTLPNNSVVTPDGNTLNITGGTQAGSNLFHSFGEFSVPTGGAASFNNAVDIQNIISRVTGGSTSNIDGLIRANGTANLFLINPNGIIFGPNAQLDIKGSFVGTTANALQFGNRGLFSATEKNIPSALLTVNPSALLFNQINQNAAIQNSSVAFAGTDPAGFNAFGLRVPNGKSLLLVGGNVSMDGGRLNVFDGRVELGGLAQAGSVALGVNGDDLSLRFPENVARASVSLTNQAGIRVTGAGGGNIAVNANNLEILGRSLLSAGIGQGLGTPETVAGDITLNATGEIKVAGTGSSVLNRVRLGSLGNGGNITIDSGSFSLQDGTRLSASTYGQGNAGNVTVRVRDAVSLADADIFSTVEAGGVGKGGNIDINAATLSLTDGASLLTFTRSTSANQPAAGGDAGNVNINVTGVVDIAGQKNGLFSQIGSAVDSGAVGNGGNITIDSGSLSLHDGAALIASTSGLGNAGNVTVRAQDAISLADADILNTVESGTVGNGGNITIETGRLTIRDGAQVGASTYSKQQGGNLSVNASESVEVIGFSARTGPSKLFTQTSGLGAGTAGNLTIQTGQLTVRDGAQVSANTFGDGQGGNLSVNASKFVELLGTSSVTPNDLFASSGLFAGSSRAGSAGNLTIQTGQLTVRDGAMVSTRTFGKGWGGNLSVNALQSVELSGTSAAGLSSGLFSDNQGDTGDAGDLKIQTRQLTVWDGAQVQAGTFGEGQGGRLEVFASESIFLSGTSPGGRPSGLLNEAFGTGSAGDFIITTGQLTVQDSGVVSATTAGAGAAGNLRIQARQLTIQDSAQISAGTFGEGQGGKLEVFALESVDLSGISTKSQLTSGLYTQTQGAGSAGDLTIQTGQLTVRDGARVSTGTQGIGSAGDLTIQTERLTIRDGAQVGTGTFSGSKGSGGNLSVIASESVELTGSSAVGERSGLFSQTQGTGSAGDLTIQTGKLLIRNGAQVGTGTFGEGKGGNLTVDAQNVQVIDDRGGLFASTDLNSTGDAGDLTIKTNTLLVRDGAAITVESLGTGTAGIMTLNSPSIRLDNNALLSANTRNVKVDPTREQATININSESLIMRRNSNIRTNATGKDVIGGNINIDTDFLIASGNSDISANSANFRGGNVQINAQGGIFGTQFRDVASDSTSDITATGLSAEFSGTVELNTPGIDPNSGLLELPTVPVDTQVAQTCQAGGNLAKSSFTITGRGGLPPNPGDALNADAVQVDLITLNPSPREGNSPPVTIKPTTATPAPIVEATGWGTNTKGEIVLTANASTATPHSNWQQSPVTCSRSNAIL